MHVGSGTNTENNALVFNRGVKPTISGTQTAILAETSGIDTGESLTFMADSGYKFLDDAGTTEWVRIKNNGNVGIGTTVPYSKLHVFGGSAGTVTTHSGTVLTVENNANAFISILSPNDKSGGIIFGDNNSNAQGLITYNHPTDWLIFYTQGTVKAYLDSNGDFVPGTQGLYDLGTSSWYWGEINYKTLADRGCLGSFDTGVELQNGSIVSDVEALKAIKIHPTKQTVYGKPMLDYQSMPKAVYLPADHKGKILPRDENDEPYLIETDENGTETKVMAADGAETTALISIMLGAIKELDAKNQNLQQQVNDLKILVCSDHPEAEICQ